MSRVGGRRARRKRKKGAAGPANLQGLSPRQMQKALGQINTKDLENVVEVIVRTKEEEIVLENPEVTIMDVGQEIWNIIPQSVRRQPLGSSPAQSPEEIEIKEDDVNLIVSTTKVSKEEAEKALRNAGGDVAAAIMSLK